MERSIKYDDGAKLYAVIGIDGYIMECFDTEKQASEYLAEFELTMPKTVGDVMELAKKHGALFRHD